MPETRNQPAKREYVGRQSLFSAELAMDDGPSARAAVISLAVHFACVAGLTLWVHFGVPVSFRPYKITMLRETRLIDPLLFSPQLPRATAGGGTGSRRPLPPSHGAIPPRSELRSPSPSLVITTPRPKLQVSPTLLDVPAPKIENDFRYGDLASTLFPVSPGMGPSGIGSGPFPSAGGGTGTGAQKRSRVPGPVYRLSEVTVAPLLVYKVDPDYSEQARLARYNGTVLLRLIIDEQGTPRNIRIVRSLGLGLDEKAVEAVSHWRFRPGLKDGRAVAVDANIELYFRLL